MPKGGRKTPEVDASSMADIAFLLLIFFLVTTKIDSDKGIRVSLPPWSDVPPPPAEITDRNAFVVIVNSKDQLLVEGDVMDDLSLLKKRAKEFISNPNDDPDMASSPQKAVISFKGDRGTSYGLYIEVYNELRAAYNELRDEKSLELYKKKFTELIPDLDTTEIKKVKQFYPLRLSEADPVDYSKQ